jgi:hypothetical protein
MNEDQPAKALELTTVEINTIDLSMSDLSTSDKSTTEKENVVIISPSNNNKIRLRQQRYYPNPNLYPNMNVTMEVATETDDELFNNLFDEEQVILENNLKRYLFCSSILVVYALMGYMYYNYIYIR